MNDFNWRNKPVKPKPAPLAKDIHSCSYFCDRPACVKNQRDEMRDALMDGLERTAKLKELNT